VPPLLLLFDQMCDILVVEQLSVAHGRQHREIMIMNNTASKKLIRDSFASVFMESPLKTPAKRGLTLAAVCGYPDLTQSKRIQLGNRTENAVNLAIKKHPATTSQKGDGTSLWMNTDTNEVSTGGNGQGKKDMDCCFALNNENDYVYYFEIKTNLNLDTEKSKASIEKVKKITTCLEESGRYPRGVFSSHLSPLWDDTDVVISSTMKHHADIMFFGQFCELMGWSITREDWIDMLQDVGKKFLKEQL